MQKIDRTGEENINNQGSSMKILVYKSSKNVTVQFQDRYKYTKNTIYKAFKRGEIKNPFHKSVYNIGYIGNENLKISINNKPIKPYVVWNDMIRRCYSEDSYINSPSYVDCTVCEEWHSFYNFYLWYLDNHYDIEYETMAIDKDILHKGNKIYSPDNCVFVPSNINSLFTKSDAIRGDNPIGVCWHNRDECYEAWCNDGYKDQIYLGRFQTEEDAFYTYKKFKENLIKQIAKKYKDKIPLKLYEALNNYVVDITD